MTLKKTIWSPDTCECILEYQWDDTTPEDNRPITLSTIINKCSIHSSLNTNNDVWNSINEENPRKNITRQLLLDNAPSTLYDIIDATNGTREFKNGISFNWSWTGTAPNRVLNISVTGITLTNAQKNTIRNILNNRFGVGKVTLS